MSKFDIGVGDEFPLEEQPAEDHRGHRGGRHRHHRHRHGHHHHHGHARRGMLHLPLILGVAVLAAMIGAGKISLFATHAILAVAGVAILLAIAAHFWHHRHWHRSAQ